MMAGNELVGNATVGLPVLQDVGFVSVLLACHSKQDESDGEGDDEMLSRRLLKNSQRTDNDVVLILR